MKIFEDLKGFGRKHKGKLIALGIGLTALVVVGVCSKEKEEITETLALPEPEPFDFGRDLDMVFQTKEGEILGKIGCTESCMDDMVDPRYGGIDYRINKEEA